MIDVLLKKLKSFFNKKPVKNKPEEANNTQKTFLKENINNQIVIPQKAIDIIKEFEGFKSTSYVDVAGIKTIGYGTTNLDLDFIDKKTAEKYLIEHVKKDYVLLKRLLKVKLNENQISALLSFIYNVGINAFAKSTLLKRINSNAPVYQIQIEFLRWKYANNRSISGLLNRRIKEYELYITKEL